jgi:hypothetical protein
MLFWYFIAPSGYAEEETLRVPISVEGERVELQDFLSR